MQGHPGIVDGAPDVDARAWNAASLDHLLNAHGTYDRREEPVYDDDRIVKRLLTAVVVEDWRNDTEITKCGEKGRYCITGTRARARTTPL